MAPAGQVVARATDRVDSDSRPDKVDSLDKAPKLDKAVSDNKAVSAWNARRKKSNA